MVHLTPADISDSAGAQVILGGIRKRSPWVKHWFAGGSYDRLKPLDKAAYLDFVIEVIRRSDDQKGFEVLPRRWVVERNLRLDDKVAPPLARLRGPPRRLRGHDPPRHRRKSATQNHSPVICKRTLERQQFGYVTLVDAVTRKSNGTTA
jgi:hypothetical protein